MDFPFSLDSNSHFEKWRDTKLKDYPTNISDLVIRVENPLKLSTGESMALRQACAKTNFAIYECKNPMEKTDLKALGQQLGLIRMDHNLCADESGISTLEVKPGGVSSEYIPYSNRLLNWHSDGYYNPADLRIRAFILHCASPAVSGGETRLLDHEVAYLMLREKNPDFIRELMHPRAMMIPANRKDQQIIREECTGPVFLNTGSGNLEIRYTARTRSIRWRNNPVLSQAREALASTLEDSRFVFSHTLQANQGLICNNTLHSRTAFADSSRQSRLMYRARYYDRVQDI